MRQLLVVLAVLIVSACGSPEPSISSDDLFLEYFKSTTVKNDLLAVGAKTSGDRQATLAAYYSPDQLRSALLLAYSCDKNENMPEWHEERCRRNSEVERAAAGGELFARSVIVKRANGSLELIHLFVAKSAGRSVLIDLSGKTYTDLENFRDRNRFLEPDDTMLTSQNIATAPGVGDIVTVTGRTEPTWLWWVIGGGLLGVVTIGGVLVLAAGRSQQRRLTVQQSEA